MYKDLLVDVVALYFNRHDVVVRLFKKDRLSHQQTPVRLVGAQSKHVAEGPTHFFDTLRAVFLLDVKDVCKRHDLIVFELAVDVGLGLP